MENEQKNELVVQSQGILETAKTLAIKTDKQFENAGGLLVDIKRLFKEIKEFFEPMRKKTYAAYQEVTGTIKATLKPGEDAERILKKKMSDYSVEQERMRRAEAERLRKIELAKEEERRLNDAIETGDETALYNPPLQPETQITIEKPKAQGVSMRTVYKYRVIDADKLPRCFMIPDDRAIKKIVDEQGMETEIPGIEVYEEKIVVARTK